MLTALSRSDMVLRSSNQPAAAEERVDHIGGIGEMSGFAFQVGGPGRGRHLHRGPGPRSEPYRQIRRNRSTVRKAGGQLWFRCVLAACRPEVLSGSLLKDACGQQGAPQGRPAAG